MSPELGSSFEDSSCILSVGPQSASQGSTASPTQKHCGGSSTRSRTKKWWEPFQNSGELAHWPADAWGQVTAHRPPGLGRRAIDTGGDIRRWFCLANLGNQNHCELGTIQKVSHLPRARCTSRKDLRTLYTLTGGWSLTRALAWLQVCVFAERLGKRQEEVCGCCFSSLYSMKTL